MLAEYCWKIAVLDNDFREPVLAGDNGETPSATPRPGPPTTAPEPPARTGVAPLGGVPGLPWPEKRGSTAVPPRTTGTEGTLGLTRGLGGV